MRKEGEFWNAYLSQVDTMQNALLLGSIRIELIDVPQLRTAFYEAMSMAMTLIVQQMFDVSPDDVVLGDTKPAPESEKDPKTRH
jgi:hypothetical protein